MAEVFVAKTQSSLTKPETVPNTLCLRSRFSKTACVEVNQWYLRETFVSLYAIEETQRVDGVGRPKFDFHTGIWVPR